MLVVNLFSSSNKAKEYGVVRLYNELCHKELCVEMLKGKDYGVEFDRLIIETPVLDVINFFIKPCQRAKDDVNAELKLDRLGINYIGFEEGEEAYSEAAGLILHMVKKHEK